jgi:hypothetical protein
LKCWSLNLWSWTCITSLHWPLFCEVKINTCKK